MLCFPNAKINIGLNIVSKRSDGYHNLETIFYPVPLTDILEFVVTEKSTNICVSGTDLNIPPEKNICIKAYQLLKEDYKLPNLEIYLHKIIPSGAGLGGGSADASFLLKSINQYFKLNIPEKKLIKYASKLGADCAFFLKNKAIFASGTGNVFENIKLDLKGYYIVIIKPDFSISTPEAFKNIIPKYPEISLKELIQFPVSEWKDKIINDFETGLFKTYPLLANLKQKLYDEGALYASMSGSGSTLYGIFKEKPLIKDKFSNVFFWQSKL